MLTIKLGHMQSLNALPVWICVFFKKKKNLSRAFGSTDLVYSLIWNNEFELHTNNEVVSYAKAKLNTLSPTIKNNLKKRKTLESDADYTGVNHWKSGSVFFALILERRVCQLFIVYIVMKLA